jgi:Na+-transporting methylmalonyl-CoA/oxaloacetate decarboxylase gamma subunit
MNTLGISMIVAGVAFLFSGLIFLLPIERRLSAREQSVEESQTEIEHHLEQMRSERGEL